MYRLTTAEERRWAARARGARNLLASRMQPEEIDMSDMTRTDDGLSTGLALFSLCLGTVELLAPRWLARVIGVDVSPGTMRTFGLREIASGITMLAQPESPKGARSRLAGDVMDL